jgi:O-antigen ligase
LTSSRALLTVLIAVLPLLGLLSAMAMTPALILASLLLAGLAGWRAVMEPQHRAMWAVLGATLAWPEISAIWSITPAVSITTALRVGVLMALGAAAYIYAGRTAISPRAGLMMVFALIVCILALLSELIPGGGVIRWAHAALDMDYSRFIDKNINRGLCALVILSWPAMVALHAAGQGRLALVLPALLAVPVFGFDSRSAQLALVMGLLAYLAVRAAPKLGPRALAVLIPAGLIIWPLAFPLLDRVLFSDPAIYNALPGTAQHRVEIWRFVMERFAEKPVLGWGMDTSRAMPGGDVIYSGERKYLPLHPHNSALQILLELGIVGFVLAVDLVVLALRRWAVFDAPSPAMAAAAGLITAYLCIGFTAFGVWQYWWIGLGWLAAVLWRGWARN